jgi:hypothetical protein
MKKGAAALAAFAVFALWYAGKQAPKKKDKTEGDDDDDVGVDAGYSRWYAPITDGAFEDLVDSFKDAGAACEGGPPVVHCQFPGVLFALTHDVEGGVRVTLLDLSTTAGLPAVWSKIEAVVKR